MMSSFTHDVVVVGGGISGLATAWWLSRQGVDVVVLERGPEAGGTMQTVRENGWLVETGPNSALETTPLLRRLAEEAGIGDQWVYANAEADNRYIVRGRSLHPLPMKPLLFLRSRLWSLRGKLRILQEPFIGRAQEEETIASFVERRLGREFLDYAINPFVAGVYAGDPDQLSVRAAFPKLYALEEKYGGLVRGMILGARERRKRQEKAKDRARLFSFRDGMQALPRALGAGLGAALESGTEVISLSAARDSGFELRTVNGGREETVRARVVILAVPSYHASGLLGRLTPSLATSLKKIYYPPVAEVFLGFRTADVGRALDGFGFLIPAKERRSILGTIWSSVLFPGRAPEGMTALTTFVGGSRQPNLVGESDDALVERTVRELRDLMHMTGEPSYRRVTRWERAIPQYQLGHLSIVREMEACEARFPGLIIAGNFRGGIAVGDCVMNSAAVAQRAAAALGVPSPVLS